MGSSGMQCEVVFVRMAIGRNMIAIVEGCEQEERDEGGRRKVKNQKRVNTMRVPDISGVLRASVGLAPNPQASRRNEPKPGKYGDRAKIWGGRLVFYQMVGRNGWIIGRDDQINKIMGGVIGRDDQINRFSLDYHYLIINHDLCRP